MKKLSQSNRRLEMAQGQMPGHSKHLSNAGVMSPAHGGTAGVQRHGSLHGGGAPTYVANGASFDSMNEQLVGNNYQTGAAGPQTISNYHSQVQRREPGTQYSNSFQKQGQQPSSRMKMSARQQHAYASGNNHVNNGAQSSSHQAFQMLQ